MSGMPQSAVIALIIIVAILVVVPVILKIIGFRIIGNAEVGIVEKLWSRKGSLHNKIIAANGDFTDVRKFLDDNGQQGPQRAILREGTYAINLAQFTVISGTDQIHFLPLGNKDELTAVTALTKKIDDDGGFK